MQLKVRANAGRNLVAVEAIQLFEGRETKMTGNYTVAEARQLAQLFNDAAEVAEERRGFTRSVGE